MPASTGTMLASFRGVAVDALARQSRLLETLQKLMGLRATELRPALAAACTCVAEALDCEKVDAFLLDQAHQTLRAAGTSETPLGRLQHELGLDSLALANGGRIVETFKTGTSHLEHHADLDRTEVRGIIEGLGVRSTLSVPLEIDGVRSGVLVAASPRPELFSEHDLKFLEITASWVGMLAREAKHLELARDHDAEQARKKGADEIVTVLAHDLRNHLQPLITRLVTMRIKIEKGKPLSVTDVDRALRSTDRLTRLTSDILDLKRIDEGLLNLNLAPVDLVELVSETAATLDTANVEVRVSGEANLSGVADADRVKQALENLVSNAITYSPHDKPVEIRVRSEEHAGARKAIVEVLDRGPGIPPEVLPTVFDRFSSGRDSKGIGLGLHLAQAIVRAHDGDLSVQARLGGGTCFRMVLPLDAPDGVGSQ